MLTRGRATLSFGILAAAVVCASPVMGNAAAHQTARSVRVTAVSKPPTTVPRKLTLRVDGSARSVSVYASKGRSVVVGSVMVARNAATRRGRISVTVPESLPAGMWFVVVCPAGKRVRCGASHTTMFKAPTSRPAPVQAHPVTDTSRTVSIVIGPAGGTVSATAADGTAFRLTIPANSVPDGTQITIAPLSSLTSARWFGKLVGGVQLGPEGLLLMHGATLTVIPKHRVPVQNWVPVSYSGQGQDVHLVPVGLSRSVIEIPVADFSGYGVGNSTSGASGAPAGNGTSAWYESQLLDLSQQMQDGNTSAQDFNQAVEEVFDQWLNQIMITQVPPGLSDDDAARDAIQSLLRWTYEAELLSIPNATSRTAPTIVQLLNGIYARAQDKCANQHDLAQISKIIDVDRQLTLLASGHTFTEDVKCARFRVEFDSTVTISPGGSQTGSWTYEYVAQPTVTLTNFSQTGAAVFTGSTTGSYEHVGGTVSSADSWTQAVSGTGATFAVDNFCLRALNSACTAQPSIMFDIGMPTELYLDNSGVEFGPVPYWAIGWQIAHADLMVTAANRTTFDATLNAGAGALVATDKLSGSGIWGGTGQVTDSTTIDVYHTPPGS